MNAPAIATRTHAPLRPTGRAPWRRLRLMLDLWSERRMLARLDRRALADLGLGPGDVARETRRPPWDCPPTRWG
ncbi:MAG: hypothetical protein AcusKO_40980 [Acuticoccus sp.]